MYTHAFSHVWLFVTPWNVAYYVPSPWNFPDLNTGMGYHFLLQGIFPTQGSNSHLLCLMHWLSHFRLFATRGSRTGLYSPTSLVALTVKRLPAMQETWVQSLGQEDPLEKEMATHSSILAWKVPWTEEPSRLQSMGLQRVRHDWASSLSLSHSLGILQARILEWVACPFSRGSSQPRDWTQVSHVAGGFFTSWATAGGFFTNWAIREAPRVGRWVLHQLIHVVLVVKNPPVNAWYKRCGFYPWVGKIPWNRKRHHTSVVLPGKFNGQRRLAGYSPWDSKQLDMSEWLGTHSLVYK